MKKNNSQLINQDSGDTEYYTPRWIIEKARRVMGGIDLDPASSAIANEKIGATTYFTRDDDTLNQAWFGRVWMNHPFSRSNNREFIVKLVKEYRYGNVEQACCITFASTSEAWFQPLFQFPMCFLTPRVDYEKPLGRPSGKELPGATKGSVVTYLGPWVDTFIAEFVGFGGIMIPAAMWNAPA